METLIDNSSVTEIARKFEALSALVSLKAIRDETGYIRAIDALNMLLDAGGADESNRLADLVHILGLLIAEYEEAHAAPSHASPADLLRFLMEQHQLRQSDLTDVGSQGVVSEILNGKRALNLRQAKVLAARFGLPVSTWLGK